MSNDARRTEASRVTDRLRDEIIRGVMPPGARLKLVPLARRFAISRGPLREAASRLAAEGLVTIEDQRGFRVTPISRADLRDVTRTRQRIERIALRDAIAHGDLEWEGRVAAALHMLDRCTPPGDDPERQRRFTHHHAAFHDALVSACPSSYLLEFRARLYALTERYRHLATASRMPRVRGRDVGAEHRAIADAAVGRRTDEACALLVGHLAETASGLIEAYPDLFGDG